MPQKRPRFNAGFTLIELLIVVVVVSVLACIALPTYNDAILKTRRSEARSALHSVMLQQERYYTEHNTYSAFTSSSENSPFKNWSGNSPSTGYYEISATTCEGQQLTQCVLLVASSSRVIDPICGKLMLDSRNNRSYSMSNEPNSLCW